MRVLLFRGEALLSILRAERADLNVIHPKITLNQTVAFLGLVLSLSLFMLMTRYGVPEKIAFGAAILSILVVAIFWTAINLGDDDED